MVTGDYAALRKIDALIYEAFGLEIIAWGEEWSPDGCRSWNEEGSKVDPFYLHDPSCRFGNCNCAERAKQQDKELVNGHMTSCLYPVERYSSDMSNATELVNLMVLDNYEFIMTCDRRGVWTATFAPVNVTIQNTNPALAICLAVLKIKGDVEFVDKEWLEMVS